MWQKLRNLWQLNLDPTTAVSARVGVMYQLNQWVRVKNHEVCIYENNGKPFLGGQRYLSPGAKLRGWLAEVVPERMQFVDGFMKGNTADFLLSIPPHLLPSGR